MLHATVLWQPIQHSKFFLCGYCFPDLVMLLTPLLLLLLLLQVHALCVDATNKAAMINALVQVG
jgi:hypothetical protein